MTRELWFDSPQEQEAFLQSVEIASGVHSLQYNGCQHTLPGLKRSQCGAILLSNAVVKIASLTSRIGVGA